MLCEWSISRLGDVRGGPDDDGMGVILLIFVSDRWLISYFQNWIVRLHDVLVFHYVVRRRSLSVDGYLQSRGSVLSV